MPELPDVTVYVESLRHLYIGHALERIRLASPFVLRSFTPKVADVVGKPLRDVRRMGKRIVFGFESDLFVVVHLMIAGRFRVLEPNAPIPKKLGLAAFDWTDAPTLLLTEASTKKRASIHLAHGEAAVQAMNPGGLEPLGASPEAFAAALGKESRTLKRALTDPHIFSGIGNAYSDEILHRAELSPLRLTRQLTPPEMARLQEATEVTLIKWTNVLRDEASKSKNAFPEKVTAFRPDMAVHGKFGEPCPRCGAPVQRIVYAANEANYCAPCQTEGKLLADRSLSRLLGKDWPRSLEELEERKEQQRVAPSPRESEGAGKTVPTQAKAKRATRTKTS